MLEEDFSYSELHLITQSSDMAVDTAGIVLPITPTNRTSPGGNFISYMTFLESYWPHFSQTLTKGIGMLSSCIFMYIRRLNG